MVDAPVRPSSEIRCSDGGTARLPARRSQPHNLTSSQLLQLCQGRCALQPATAEYRDQHAAAIQTKEEEHMYAHVVWTRSDARPSCHESSPPRHASAAGRKQDLSPSERIAIFYCMSLSIVHTAAATICTLWYIVLASTSSIRSKPILQRGSDYTRDPSYLRPFLSDSMASGTGFTPPGSSDANSSSSFRLTIPQVTTLAGKLKSPSPRR